MKDQYGLYVQADQDGGDSLHRCGLMLCLFYLKNDTQNFFSLMSHMCANQRTIDGHWFRHPVQWNQLDDVSRDQASRAFLGLSLYEQSKPIAQRYYFKVISQNFLRHPNGDFLGIGEFSQIIRLFSCWWLYPILLLTDFHFVADIYLRNKWDGASLFLPDIFVVQKYKTPWVWLAQKIVKTKPELFAEMRVNHSLEKNGCVEILELVDLIEKKAGL